MFGQPAQNPNGLRIIKTARTLEAINMGARQGLRPLLKRVTPSSSIHNMLAVYQSRQTGEIELCGDLRYTPEGDYECVIPFHFYYPYKFPEPFAAYLLPPGIESGERVWLEDVIEDVVAVFGNQGWTPRLEACEAIWADGDFDIQFDPNTDAPMLIG